MAYPTVDKPYGLKPIKFNWWSSLCGSNSPEWKLQVAMPQAFFMVIWSNE
jgi:hypothetical protein